MNKDNFKGIKNILLITIFIVLMVIFFSLLFATKDSSLVKDLKEFIKSDTKVLSITNKKEYSNYPVDLFKKYEVNYLYINSSNLSKIEKSKIEKIINSKYLSNIIVVFKDGKIKDAIIEYESEDKLNKFLQKNDIIPDIIGDNEKIISAVNKLLETDYTIIYLPYKKIDEIEYQDRILADIAEEYNIRYKMIDAYLLSNSQKEKLNSILEISTVEDQIIILVKDSKIIGSIRDIDSKNAYLNKLEEYNFIEKISNYITYINYSKYGDLLNNDNKNIIVIGKDECRYCDNVIETLNTIAINYDIEINYINVGSIDSEIANNVKKTLEKLYYKDGFTTPLILIVENNRLLDYIIGVSNEQYLVDIFRENGIIKKEVR